MTKFGIVITHMGNGIFLGGQPRHCICTNASRGLSATTGFLVQYLFNTKHFQADAVKFLVFLSSSVDK